MFVHAYATDTPDIYAHTERCAHTHESAQTHGRQTLMRACVLTVHACTVRALMRALMRACLLTVHACTVHPCKCVHPRKHCAPCARTHALCTHASEHTRTHERTHTHSTPAGEVRELDPARVFSFLSVISTFVLRPVCVYVVCVLRVCVDVYLAHSHVALRFSLLYSGQHATYTFITVCALASCVFFAMRTHMGFSVLSDPA